MKTLILGLGNDLLGDDAVGILAARELAVRLEGRTDVDVVESPLHGVALLEHFIGYDRAIIIDAIRTGTRPPGSIIEIDPDDLKPAKSASPHYAGIPELFAIAKELELEFPKEVRIIAIEVEDPYTIGGEMTEKVRLALPELLRRVEEMSGE
jgi:hydrogenase maturation protease